MFHPLVEDVSKLKDLDLESKILDLTKKYYISLQLGQGNVAGQIILILDMCKEEYQKRQRKSLESSIKRQAKDLDDLINVG